MKKLFASALAALLAISLYGCGSKNEVMYEAVDGAYNVTAQEYVEWLNDLISEQGDSRYATVPDFVASGEKIEICPYRGFQMFLSTNEDGYVTEFKFQWELGSDKVNATAPFVVGAAIGSTAGTEYGEAVWEQLDMMNPSSPKYETTASAGGSTFKYDCYYKGIYSTLIISPDSVTA